MWSSSRKCMDLDSLRFRSASMQRLQDLPEELLQMLANFSTRDTYNDCKMFVFTFSKQNNLMGSAQVIQLDNGQNGQPAWIEGEVPTDAMRAQMNPPPQLPQQAPQQPPQPQPLVGPPPIRRQNAFIRVSTFLSPLHNFGFHNNSFRWRNPRQFSGRVVDDPLEGEFEHANATEHDVGAVVHESMQRIHAFHALGTRVYECREADEYILRYIFIHCQTQRPLKAKSRLLESARKFQELDPRE
jgi:hypothetical protein